jgi:hypothetical protein
MRGRVGALAGRDEAAGGSLVPPRGRWLSSHESISRFRNRHWRPTRTAESCPPDEAVDCPQVHLEVSQDFFQVRNVSSIMRLSSFAFCAPLE